MKKITKHDSYGMMGISRTTSNSGKNLFGSSIKHQNTLVIRIKKAEVKRDLGENWFHANDPLIEIEMSSTQFAELITTFNMGDGVPCTIRYIERNRIEDPPYVGQNTVFNAELQEDFHEIVNKAETLIQDATDVLSAKGNIPIKSRKKVLDRLRNLVQHIRSNMPFLHKQFTRAMDKTVGEAKAEIESFYTNAVIKVGQEVIQKDKETFLEIEGNLENE